ncbi:hypothetical protein LS73_007445 [Helicobacter muridarum]|uniref:Periplasmic protein n=1 Tax=Helicobacter muridarum TaxID=216 RepID=A0A099TY72_9HELI|nr:hypothetical protein [Helicobacter muridarum]TLD99418.1 hypothetical protein LS73_007445 [Helicobacter muridarum]STQ85499.1 Uncharacterised protein [Helicobacter muridarum]
MRILQSLLFVSVATTGLLMAHSDMDNKNTHNQSGMHNHNDHHMELKAPDGILGEIYHKASFKQKREILQIEYEFHKEMKKQTQKFKDYRESVAFDLKNLKLDLEEAKYDRNNSKATSILNRIVKKKEELRKNKQDEKNLIYLLNEDRIKKINEVLNVK